MLKDPAAGTAFVAVGAAHLAGPDSVIKMLEKDGWKVEREVGVPVPLLPTFPETGL